VFVDTGRARRAVGRDVRRGGRDHGLKADRARRRGATRFDSRRGMPLYGNELGPRHEPLRGETSVGSSSFEKGRRLRRGAPGAREGPGRPPPDRRWARPPSGRSRDARPGGDRATRLSGPRRRAGERCPSRAARQVAVARRGRSRWHPSQTSDAEPGTMVDVEIRGQRVPAEGRGPAVSIDGRADRGRGRLSAPNDPGPVGRKRATRVGRPTDLARPRAATTTDRPGGESSDGPFGSAFTPRTTNGSAWTVTMRPSGSPSTAAGQLGDIVFSWSSRSPGGNLDQFRGVRRRRVGQAV